MVVEVIFWWHPLVWFIGSRLVHERERACDEHVLRTLHRPRLYARALLNVCRPSSGATLRLGGRWTRRVRRVGAILRNEEIEAVGPLKKAILAAAISLLLLPIVSAPLSVGRLQAQTLHPIVSSTQARAQQSSTARLRR